MRVVERTLLSPREAVDLVLTEQGRSLTWLASRVGTNRTSLHLMLIGQRQLSPEMMGNIARELGVPLTMLFDGAAVRASSRIMRHDAETDPTDKDAA